MWTTRLEKGSGEVRCDANCCNYSASASEKEGPTFAELLGEEVG
jgi:hypothetical protein